MPLWFVNPSRKGKRRRFKRNADARSIKIGQRAPGWSYKPTPAQRKLAIALRKDSEGWTLTPSEKMALARQRIRQHAESRKRLRSNPRKRPRKAKKGRKMAKLYGAAKKARNKRLAKLRAKRKRAAKKGHRKYKKNPRRRRYRRNPGPGAIVGSRRGVGQGAAIAAAVAKGKKKAKKKAGKKGKGISKKAAKARAKKAARTRAAKKAKRSKAAKKAARKRKSGGKKKGPKKMAKRRGKKLKARARRKRYGRGVRQLAKSRRTIKHQREHGSGLAKRFIKRFRMRTNPKGMIIDLAKQVLPVAVAFVGARVASSHIDKVPVVGDLLNKLGAHKGVAVAAVMVGAGFAATKYIKALGKYQNSVMVGTGLNLVLSAVQTYAPESVKAMIGMGDEAVYDEALAAYEDAADYEEVSDYETVSDYEEVGAMQETAGWAEGLTKGVGMHQRIRQLQGRSAVTEIPEFGSDPDMYTGSFAGGGSNGWGA